MCQEHGDEHVEKNAGYVELEWEWARELGMVDEDVDLTSPLNS